MEEREHEPIAIIGMSCRYPGGVSSPEELWEVVRGEVDAIGGVPQDRGWGLGGLYDPHPQHPGPNHPRAGGVPEGAGEFDAGVFRMSPREAPASDTRPRQLPE